MKLKILAVIVLFFSFLGFNALAQEGESQTLTLGDFSFEFNPEFAASVNITQYAGDPSEQGPGFSDAPHTRFTLYNQAPAPESWFEAEAGISVYRMEDLAEYEFMQAQVEQLQTLLEERPDLEEYEVVSEGSANLPYIPVLPHGQIIRAHAEYIETDAVQGVGYITYSNATAEPFISTSFTYTFQGISADGANYVSLNVPLSFGFFPAEPEPIDPEEFSANLTEYLTEAVNVLDDAAANEFSPSLDDINGLIQTFGFANQE